MKRKSSHIYLGAVINNVGGTEEEVASKGSKLVKAAWAKWKEMSGMIQDRKLVVKLRMKCIKRREA